MPVSVIKNSTKAKFVRKPVVISVIFTGHLRSAHPKDIDIVLDYLQKSNVPNYIQCQRADAWDKEVPCTKEPVFHVSVWGFDPHMKKNGSDVKIHPPQSNGNGVSISVLGRGGAFKAYLVGQGIPAAELHDVLTGKW